ncbi:type II toxin-antitoxin system YafQ family toxin [Pseudomonas sp. MWU13-3659]|uniref:type II toxin-antitoxin system RelE/ParE family toxin n=1 Tax=Pseudomonas sp. MWU13-3659 TaxID=2986964 RepID=UPI00207509F6|nr:type II toxin-antitoxin system YafQ family toxin [Pseudomonas sp. MWU13-3659]
MFKILTTPQFVIDFQLQLAKKPDITAFKVVVRSLERQPPLHPRHCDGQLVGAPGRWCCLISFDWWLVYKCDTQAGSITLEQTGPHHYLFE